MKFLIATTVLGLASAQNLDAEPSDRLQIVEQANNDDLIIVDYPEDFSSPFQGQQQEFPVPEIEEPVIDIEVQIEQPFQWHQIDFPTDQNLMTKHECKELCKGKSHDEKKKCKKLCKENYGHKNKEEEIDPFVPSSPNKHHKKNREGRHHHIGLFIIALVCTLFGVLLGKCTRKCGKNGNKCQKRQNQLRNSISISGEIREHEQKLNALKAQLQKKQQQEYASQQNRIPQRNQPRYIDQYYQPQGYYHNQRNINQNIPVGRPLNENQQQSFEPRYPQL